MKAVFTHPHRPFLITALLCFIIALVYRLYFRESYFDISARHYFSLSNYYAWSLLGGYVLLLSGIYYIAERGKLSIQKWMLKAHYIFLLLFLIFFFIFSSFNAGWMQDAVSSMPFMLVLSLYGIVFLLDVFLFIAGLISLVINLASMKK